MTLYSNQSLEAEESVLGSVFLNSNAMDDLQGYLETRDFSTNVHQLIWRSMDYLYKNNHPIDLLTVVEIMKKYNQLEGIGGVTYLSQLANAVPTAANVKYYAEIVKDHSLKRRGTEIGTKIIELSQENNFDDTETYFYKVEKLASELRPNTMGEMKHVADTKQEYMNYLQQQDDYILTGFDKFDEWAGGIGRGWLVITAGRPSVGKTARILQQAVSMARQDIGEILIWSQEMNRFQLLNRMISPISRVNSARMRKKVLDPQEMQKVDSTYDELSKLPLHIEDASGVSIEHITAVCRQMKRKHGRIGAIIVDYLTIMDIKQEKGQTWSKAVGEVTKKAKRLAREMDAPFFMLAQLSRDGADGEPQLHHLRDSGEIEQDADVVEFLWYNPDETSNHGKVIQSFVAKGRDIGINRFKYIFEGWIQRYSDFY